MRFQPTGVVEPAPPAAGEETWPHQHHHEAAHAASAGGRLRFPSDEPGAVRSACQLLLFLGLALGIPVCIYCQWSAFDAELTKHSASPASLGGQQLEGRSRSGFYSLASAGSSSSLNSLNSSGSDALLMPGEDRSRKVLPTVLVACLSHLCMGYHTAAVAMVAPYLQSHPVFADGDAPVTGTLVSVTLLGAALGAACGILADSEGRRCGLLTASIFFVTGAVFMALAQNASMLLFGAGVAGLGAGLSSCLTNVYIAEVAPAARRGELAALAPLAATAGAFAAQVGILFIGLVEGDVWRGYLGVLALPALALLACHERLPETPRWLLACGRPAAAEEAMQRLMPSAPPLVVEEELGNLIDAQAEESSMGSMADRDLWTLLARRRGAVGIAIAVGVLPHLCGIHVEYYAPKVLAVSGFGETGALAMNLLIGFGQVLSVVLAAFLVDRLGRRIVAITGTAVMLAGMGFLMIGFASLAGFTLHSHAHVAHPIVPRTLSVLGMVLFRLAFSLSLSPLPFIVTAELFGQRARATGVAVGASVGWCVNLALCQTYPWVQGALVSRTGSATATTILFGSHFLCCVAALLFIIECLPETMGKKLETIELVKM